MSPLSTPGPPEPALDADEIQGDSLAGFRKNHQYFLFFTIGDVPAFRRLLADLASELATLREVAEFNNLYRLVRNRRGAHRTGLSAVWKNIAFTARGLGLLTSEAAVNAFDDTAFTIGLAPRAGLLGDLPPDGGNDPTVDWKFGGTSRPVDGMLTIAADDPNALERAALETEQAWSRGGVVKVWAETCHVRPDLPGHEHFGFRDSISQPGIRGRIDRRPDNYISPRYFDVSDLRATRYARPGQRLIWPGEFILGLPRQQLPPADDLQPGTSHLSGPRWARNGSYVVIRRLTQDVAAFRAFNAAASTALLAAGANLTADRVAALIVGRWPSGAPLVRSPTTDEPSLGADDFAANDFGYESAWLDAAYTDPPVLDPKVELPPNVARIDQFPPGVPDDAGVICPHSSHLRKVNPRDQTTDQGGPDNTLHRRILRRGIPFGDPYSEASASQDRGLMFVSYQASIVDQFEFLMTSWVNSAVNPPGPPGGMDILIGGKPLAARTLVLSNENGDPYEVPIHQVATRPWVTATGGGYFFAPSISTITHLLAKTP